jgi:hypothetical protein
LHNIQTQLAPPGLVVHNGSNFRAHAPAGMPLPVFCTWSWPY